MSESKARSWNRLNTIFLTGTLAATAIAVPLYLVFAGFHWAEWITCAAMVFGIGTAISAGYNRHFSHRAFKASLPVRFLLLVFGAASFENSALKWASDHPSTTTMWMTRPGTLTPSARASGSRTGPG